MAIISSLLGPSSQVILPNRSTYTLCRDATHGEFGLADIGEAKEWLPEADAAIALARDDALEEAAKRCNDFLGGAWHGYEIGSAIRALKDQTTT